MATRASRIALAGSNISSTGEVDADLLDNTDSAAFLSLDGSGRLGIGTSSADAFLTVDSNIGGSSTGTLARFHSSKGESDSTYLQIAATRHGTPSVQRVQLQAFDDDGSTGRTLALNPSGGNVGIGTNTPGYLLHAENTTATGPSYIATSANGQFIMAMGSQNSPGVAQEAFIGTLNDTRFKVKVNNVEKATFTSTGLGIGNTDPTIPLTVTANSGANAIAMRARSGDDYSFLQFWNNAGTTLRGQIYNHNGSIGFTTGTDSSGGDDLYISDSNGVGINTTTTGGYNGRLTVYQDTHDAYTPTGFLDKPTMQLRHTANTDGYTGTRYANNTGTYEWFTGAHQFDGQRADLVTQGYDRDLNGYRENQRIHDTGQIVQPRQPSFMAHKTSHLSLSGAGSSEAGGWSSTHVNGAHNVGGCFNTSTGRFTAPVAGRYKFDANIMHGITSGDFQIWLCVNGNTSTCVRSNSMQSTGGNWKQTTVTGLFNLAVSDYISIFVRSSLAEPYAMYGSTTGAFTTCNAYLIG